MGTGMPVVGTGVLEWAGWFGVWVGWLVMKVMWPVVGAIEMITETGFMDGAYDTGWRSLCRRCIHEGRRIACRSRHQQQR